MKTRQIKFVAHAVLWFDKVNGNTYHSVRITRIKDNKMIFCQFQYGYGEQYRFTALKAMSESKWLPKKYRDNNEFMMFERENNYPILWHEHHGLKKECIKNGSI